MRLNKLLAQAGFGSRRQCDDIISQSRVTINHQKAKLGQQVETNDHVEVDNRIVNHQAQPEPKIIRFHKPRGIPVTKSDRFAPVTVMDYLPQSLQHLNPVGRLDKLSSGLLLFTNDGTLAYSLTHPKFEHEKEYTVEFCPFHALPTQQIEGIKTKLCTSIIDPKLQTRPLKIVDWTFNVKQQRGTATLILHEGKKRQIRELFKAVGLFVTVLHRTRIGPITLDGLKVGEHAPVNPNAFKH